MSERVVSALTWRFVAAACQFFLRLGVLIVLARLVPVEAFGLLSLATVVTVFASKFTELGMVPALIQREGLTDKHVRVAFTISVGSGAALCAAIWFGAPAAAALLGAREAAPLLRLLSVTFLLNGLGATAAALLQREFRFRRIAGVELASYMFGYGLVGITLACLGYGVWALACANVSGVVLRVAMLYGASPHPAKPCFALAEARQLLRFGGGETLGRVVSFCADQGDYFVVGRWLGPAALGLYSRAYNTMLLPIKEFSSVIDTVLFPAYARIQDDRARLSRAYLASVSLTTLVIAPALTALAVGAPELIGGVFGPQWAGAVAPLQILCVGGVFRSYGLGDSVTRAQGAVVGRLWRHMIFAVLVVGGAAAGSRWGVVGVSVAVVCALAVIYFLMAHLSIRMTGVGWGAFLCALLPGAAVAAAVAGVTIPTTGLLRAGGLHPLAVLAWVAAAAAATALSAAVLIPRRWHHEGSLSVLDAAARRVLTLAAGSCLGRGVYARHVFRLFRISQV